MKFLLFSICIFGVLATEARPKDVSLNQDVFVCADGVRSLPLTEYLLINRKKITINEKLNTRDDLTSWLNADLNQLTSSRARLFNHIARNFGGRISFQKNIQVQRVNFPSQLILPKGCQVQPIAVFTLFVDSFNKPFSAVIDQDLFERLSAEDQVIVLWEMALDIEQAMFAMNIQRNDLTADFDFNQLRTRQFIQCWLDSDCKPKNAADFHQMAKNLKLDYFEQEEVLIPRNAAVFGKNGLIVQSKSLVNLITREFKEVFVSRTNFRGQIISIPELAGSNFSNAVIFRDDGRLRCAGLLHIQQTVGLFPGMWSSVESDTAWPFEFPMCWNEKFQLTQGYFPIPWETKFTFKVQGQTVRIEQDKLAGGKDQGTIVILDQDDLSIKWVNHVIGEVSVGVNGKLPISGYLKLRKDQSVECAQISTAKDLKKAGGGIYKYRDGQGDYILCFNAKGEYEKAYAMYDFFAFLQSDLVLVGNK